MPRKFFRRVIPSVDKVREVRALSLFGERLFHPALWHLNRRSAAGGVAVGLFCGLIPGPLQMLGAGIVCVVLRVNLPVSLVTTLYTNPLTIVPLYLLGYEIGSFVMGASGAIDGHVPAGLRLVASVRVGGGDRALDGRSRSAAGTRRLPARMPAFAARLPRRARALERAPAPRLARSTSSAGTRPLSLRRLAAAVKRPPGGRVQVAAPGRSGPPVPGHA